MLEHVKSNKPVKLALLAAYRPVFDLDAARAERVRIEKKLDQLGVDWVGLDWLNDDGLLSDPADAPRVAERFAAEGVDAVLAAHCNFGTEVAIGRACAALRKPVLVWGPRDEGPGENGMRLRDTQCGLFATGKLLRRLGLPFSYIVNCHVDDEVFARGLDNFLRAVNVARCVRGARIGQVDTRPGPFTSVMYNESELLERFGIEIEPIALGTLTSDVLERRESDEVTEEMSAIAEQMEVGIDEDDFRLVVALKLALRDWAAREKLDGIALQCWSALQEELGICSCFVHGQLTDLGVPVACETDVHGAVTAIACLAAARAETVPFFADLTIRHPDNENAELLWHCGPFPLSLADSESPPRLSGHYLMPSSNAGVGEFRIRGGDVTVARFDGDNGTYRMFIGEGRGADGPYTRGTYLWIEVGDWPKWEERLVCGPYVHHVAGVHGKLAAVLYEACKYIGVEPEAVEPTAEQIGHYLRGGSAAAPAAEVSAAAPGPAEQQQPEEPVEKQSAPQPEAPPAEEPQADAQAQEPAPPPRHKPGRHGEQQWYVAVGGQRYGPYPTRRMWDLIEEGRLNGDTKAWNQQLSEWVARRESLPFASKWG